MNPADELAALYAQWRSLSDEEGAAIDASAWVQVEQFQLAKARLQPRITEVSQRLDAGTHRQQFDPVLQELMQLERRNAALLQQQRERTEQQLQDLDRSSRHLRQLQKSYVSPAQMQWQSYS